MRAQPAEAVSTATKTKSRGGRPSRAEAPQRAEHLLNVATEHFVRLGYSATTVDRIAVEAGVGKRTIYSRYPDKEKLFFAVVQRLSEKRVFDQLPIGDDVPLEEGLRRLARTMIDSGFKAEQLTIGRMILTELNHFPDLGKLQWQAIEDEHGRKLIRYFRHQKQKGAIRNLRPSFLADLFLSNVFSFINNVAIMGQPIPTSAQIEEFIDDLIDILVNGMRQ